MIQTWHSLSVFTDLIMIILLGQQEHYSCRHQRTNASQFMNQNPHPICHRAHLMTTSLTFWFWVETLLNNAVENQGVHCIPKCHQRDHLVVAEPEHPGTREWKFHYWIVGHQTQLLLSQSAWPCQSLWTDRNLDVSQGGQTAKMPEVFGHRCCNRWWGSSIYWLPLSLASYCCTLAMNGEGLVYCGTHVIIIIFVMVVWSPTCSKASTMICRVTCS